MTSNGGASGAVAPGSSHIGGNSMVHGLRIGTAPVGGRFSTVAKVVRCLGGALRR